MLLDFFFRIRRPRDNEQARTRLERVCGYNYRKNSLHVFGNEHAVCCTTMYLIVGIGKTGKRTIYKNKYFIELRRSECFSAGHAHLRRLLEIQ